MLTDKTEVEEFFKTYFYLDCEYSISNDGVIDVVGNIDIEYELFNKLNLTEFPIQFGHVKGNFEIQISNIKKLKGFPHTVDGYLSIDRCKNIKSLELSPKCGKVYARDCGLKSLNGLNCYKFYVSNLNLKSIGTNFNAKEFVFDNFPTPTANEMRQFIQLNPKFYTEQEAPWIELIKDYHEHKDIFIAITEFETLYNEPWIKPENKIEIIKHNNDVLSF